MQIWNKPKTTATLTLTSGGTLVGTGDAAYIYGTGTLAGITDDFDDVADNGDYFLIAKEEPSDLQVKLPATDILDAPWVETDGSNVTPELTNAIQGDNEEVTLTPDFRVDVTNVDYYIQITEASKQISIRMPSSQVGSQDDEDAKRLLQPNAWVEIGGWKVDVTTNANRSVVGASLRFSFNYGEVLAGAKPTGSTTRKVTVVGADVHRGEIAKPAFAEETPSIAGKGGAAGKIWSYVSSATDAAWSRLLDVLKLDANTAAKKADYQAALATGRLQKSVAGNSNVTLTDAEAAYDSIEFTGAKTGNIVVTLPTKPSGMRMLKNSSTGSYTLKVKVSGQNDSAAIELTAGDNAVFHDGSSLSLFDGGDSLPDQSGHAGEYLNRWHRRSWAAASILNEWVSQP